MRSLTGNVLFFVALLATALALGGALAHLLEMPAKLGMSRDDYFTVQQIYAGWNRLALLLLVELIGMIGVAVVYRAETAVLVATLIALAFLVAAQAIFWTFTFPANAATANWTSVPENWAQLRAQWEYSHAAGAICQMLAMASLIVAVLSRP